MANFQSVVPNQLAQAGLLTTVQTLYAVPTAVPTRTYVKDVDITNPGGAPITATIWVVEAGGAPGDGTAVALVPGVAIPANGGYQWVGTQVLLPGMTVQGVATATGLGVLISGGEAT